MKPALNQGKPGRRQAKASLHVNTYFGASYTVHVFIHSTSTVKLEEKSSFAQNSILHGCELTR